MYNRHPKRLQIAEYYENHGVSIRETARIFHVHYQSVFKWVTKYREKGAAGLLDTYKKPWNRIDISVEHYIAQIKEKDPTLTVRKAREVMQAQSIRISLKGIWQIWRRYGYAGFVKTRLSNDFADYCAWTPESRHRFRQASILMRRGDTRAAAEVLNSIPLLPHNNLLARVPEGLCNLRRKVERRSHFFGKIPLDEFLQTVRALYEECLRQEYRHSALRTGIIGIMALSWAIRPAEQLKETHALMELLKRRGMYYSNSLFAPRLILNISEGIAYAHLSEIAKATRCAGISRAMLQRRSHTPYDLMVHLGTLYNQLENYREAGVWYERALALARGSAKRAIYTRLAEIFFLQGRYDKALRTLRQGSTYGWTNETRRLFYRAMQSFMKGMPGRSIELATKALTIAQKDNLDWGLIKAYNAIASAHLALGETDKARYATKRLVAYSKKLRRAETAIETLLSSALPPIHMDRDTVTTTRLAVLLKRGYYRKAYRLAQQKGIMAYLHRFIFYVPECVRQHIGHGKLTGLPQGILRLPIFNRTISVYAIRFLGDLVVYKDRRYVKQRLGLKDQALLIHLALRIGEPGTGVAARKVCHNFWEHGKEPMHNLSHAILRLKKSLKIPPHYLTIARMHGESFVVNRGLYLVTDHAELEQKLATARAFARVGERDFARADYLSALRLVRGRIFHKMYDTWSEEVRRAVANKIEKAMGRLEDIRHDRAPDPAIERIRGRMRRVLGW